MSLRKNDENDETVASVSSKSARLEGRIAQDCAEPVLGEDASASPLLVPF